MNCFLLARAYIARATACGKRVWRENLKPANCKRQLRNSELCIAAHFPGQGSCRNTTSPPNFSKVTAGSAKEARHESLVGLDGAIRRSPLLLLEQLVNVVVEEQTLQFRRAHVLGPRNPFAARVGAAIALEGLGHVPFGAWVEEGQVVAFLEADDIATAITAGSNSDFDGNCTVDAEDMKLHTGLTGMIGEEKVAVELDMLGAGDLDGGVGLGGDGQGRHGDAG